MRVPSLRRHRSGNYFCRWGGKDHYFGRDRHVAEGRWLESLAKWKAWQEAKRAAKPHRSRRFTVRVLVDKFYDTKRTEVGPGAERYYRKHLRRFVNDFGDFPADFITPEHLQDMKLDLVDLGLARKTVNHDLTAVRVLFNWASGLGLVPPVQFKGVRNLSLGPVQDRTLTAEAVHKLIHAAPMKIRPWLAVNYLALLRPSEVVRVVHGHGEWVAEGVFRLDRGKMDERSSIKRHCLFSPRALEWMNQAEPHWSRLDSYGAAAVRLCGQGPKLLQKSAAQHLVSLHDVPPSDVELLLGHVRGRLSVTYYQPHWQRLREYASRLSV